jgi:hypothetical protein
MGTKTSDLTALTGANTATGDLLAIVDVSDATMAPSGTTKKITRDELKTALLAAPGPIGATTPAAGAFTTLTIGGIPVMPAVNNIGVAGGIGFGVGIAPELPTGMSPLPGTYDQSSANYGNYQYSDGSVMVWVPAFWYKYGTGANGFAVNVCDVKSYATYADVTTAAAAGYALHRAFYNGGAIKTGFFVDKYLCSRNGSVASSLANGIVLSSAIRGGLTDTPFSIVGAANAFYGTFAAAKTRGASFHPKTMFQNGALALLSLAHGSASTSTTYCAWYSSGATNFPKGNNNNALGDVNDGTILYTWDGNATYAGCGKTGSANYPAKVAHNGQACGVMDLNGLVWEIAPIGLTSNGTNFYLLNTAVDVATITASNTLATDCWGATGLAAMYTSLGATYGALTASNTNKVFGAAAQVLSEATSGAAWAMAGAGIPLVGGVGGSNQFGNDYMYDSRPNELCLLSGASWGDSTNAGVFALHCGADRGGSSDTFGFRSALYL